MTSTEVEDVFRCALMGSGAEVVAVPMSDGGDGMLEAFTRAVRGNIVSVSAHDPLMRPVMAEYGIAPDGTAIIETSKACGLTLMGEDERDPMAATTYGVGEIIVDAVRRGCRKFIIGLGGSGTSDAGVGMLEALARSFAEGRRIDELPETIVSECSFELACDVRNPLCGADGAAYVFAPQKGATADMLEVLDSRARRFALSSARRMGFDKSNCPGAGAAGGLGYAFMQYLGAATHSGADLLLDLVGFDRLIAGADVVITGEGSADRQTLMGKLPERVLRRAREQGIPVCLVAGKVADRERLVEAGFSRVTAITPCGMPLDEAIKPETTRANIIRLIRSAADGKALLL